MLLNHNYDELKKQMKHMSVFERCLFLDKIKEKEKDNEKIEKVLEKGTTQRIRQSGVKRWGWSNNDVL